MKICLLISLSVLVFVQSSRGQGTIPNRQIDYAAFLKSAQEVRAIREGRRLTEDQFLQMMGQEGVVLLDARSAAKFKMRHLRGAVNLSLPDFDAASLGKIIPRKDTRVLIYCNNNFAGSPVSFPTKVAGASLNISTFVTLSTYGYTNVYELGPIIDTRISKLPFGGDELSK